MAYFGAHIRDRTGPFSDHELSAIIEREITSATGSLLGTDGGGDLADQRRVALDAYYGQPFGDEVEGESQVVLTEVMDVIEWMLPDLLDTFLAGDTVCEFEAQAPEDDAYVDQATDYINYLFLKENGGFKILYDWFKDALLQKNGFVKVWWDDTPVRQIKTYRRLTDDEVALVLDDDDVERVLEQEAYEDEIEVVDPMTGEPVKVVLALTDLRVERVVEKGRLRVESFPPEEYLIARRQTNLTDPEAFFFGAHRYKTTVADLIARGIDPELVERIPSGDEEEYNEEREARFEADDEWPIQVTTTDPSMRWVWVYECHLRIDMDATGVPELWQVLVAARGRMILQKDRLDEQPVVSVTPIPVPHKFFGLSYADITLDVQRIKSVLLRGWLNNIYHLNNARHVLHPDVNLDDYLVNRPGAGVRLKKSTAIKPSEAVFPLTTVPLGDQIAPGLEYMDKVRRDRTGVDPDQQGLDADHLKNKGDQGLGMLMSQSRKRSAMVARIFAETGVPELFNKMLRLVVKNQDREKVIRLRKQWVPMDPRDWNADMKADIQVGLGHGSKEQDAAFGAQMLGTQMSLVQGQAAYGDTLLIEPKHIFNSVKMIARANGYKDATLFMNDPEEAPPAPQQQEQPDPRIIEAQLKHQIEMEKLQLEREKLELDRQRLQIDALERMAKAQGEQQRLRIDAEGKVYETDRANTEALETIQSRRQELALKSRELEAKDREVRAREQLAALQAEAAIVKAEAEKAGDEARTELVIRETERKIQLAEQEYELKKAELEIRREELALKREEIAANAEAVKANGGGPAAGAGNGAAAGPAPGLTINMDGKGVVFGGDKDIEFERDEIGKLKGARVRASAGGNGTAKGGDAE